MFEIRKNIFRIVIYASFIILALNLFYLQIIRHHFYKQRSLENIVRIIPLEAPRGIIYDRNGKVLVEDRISFDLAVIPQEVKNIDATLKDLSKLCGVPKKDLYSNYRKNYSSPFVPTTVAQDLDRYKAFFVDENITSVPGAILWRNPRRNFHHPYAISHITGHIGKIDEIEYETLKSYGYKIRECIGKSGIEKYYNSYLRGEDGGIQVEVDSTSRLIRQLGSKSPVKGKDIFLTIDIELQDMVNMLIKDDIGACIVMDLKTGEILALVSSPGFDPNVFIEPTQQRERSALLSRNDYPMLNRAVSSSYSPGSTFKVVVAMAALSSDKIKKNTYFHCSGTYNLGATKFNCWREDGHGSQNITEGLTHSCNVFFFNTGRMIGPDLLHQYAIKFGMGQPTGIDLPGEANGLVPSPLWKRFNKKEPWRTGDTLNFSIGQGYLLTTPIQILRMITLIANNGFMPRPFLVKRIGEVDLHSTITKKVAFTEGKSKFDTIQQALFNVVNDPAGTGQRAKVEGIEICAKTGTAQVEGREAHAWFAGYAPFNDPKISFVVFLEHGGAGGRKPAEIAKALCEYLKEKGYL